MVGCKGCNMPGCWCGGKGKSTSTGKVVQPDQVVKTSSKGGVKMTSYSRSAKK